MHDRKPRGDDQIWSAGFLPKTYQALALDARRKETIDNLVRAKEETDEQQRAALELLRDVNSTHAQARPSQADLAARIHAFLPEILGPRVFIAGDHLEDASINGAMRSGRLAAEAALTALAVR